MKFVCFTDLHADMKILDALIIRSNKEDIDAVICAGDFTIFESNIKKILKKINLIKKPVFMITGNHEDKEKLQVELNQKKYENLIYIDEGYYRMGDFLFLGHGGGGFSMRDAEFRKLSREWRKKVIKKTDKIIFITHMPPYDSKADNLGDANAGNRDYRDFILRTSPKLCVCGHLHETAGAKGVINKTLVVNPGPKGMVINVK